MGAQIVPMTVSASEAAVRMTPAHTGEICRPQLGTDYRMDVASYGGALTVVPTHAQQLLATQGKLMPGDVTVAAIPPELWDWKGDNVQHVETIYNESMSLADTGFATWTTPYASTDIRAKERAAQPTLDMVNYSYLIRWRFQFTPVYPEGTIKQGAIEAQVTESWYALYRRPEGLVQISAGSFAANVCSLVYEAMIAVYSNPSGNLQCVYGKLGIYPYFNPAARFVSADADNAAVSIYSPIIAARKNSEYFSEAMIDAIDQSASVIKIRGDLYRMSPNSTLRQIYGSVVDLFNNPM